MGKAATDVFFLYPGPIVFHPMETDRALSRVVNREGGAVVVGAGLSYAPGIHEVEGFRVQRDVRYVPTNAALLRDLHRRLLVRMSREADPEARELSVEKPLLGHEFGRQLHPSYRIAQPGVDKEDPFVPSDLGRQALQEGSIGRREGL